MTLHSPEGKTLLTGLNLSLEQGSSTLLMGNARIGKSTLIRALAGIWEYGHGEIHLPEQAKIMFLPQKPYLPIGSLQNALLYPLHQTEIDQNVLIQTLESCFLASFIPHLQDIKQWSHCLSLGEQQCLAFARVLLQKPDILFLDEATSAVNEERQTLLYKHLRQMLPGMTMISVGHRESLKTLHQHVITIAADKTEPLIIKEAVALSPN